jgi:hypothetical protein
VKCRLPCRSGDARGAGIDTRRLSCDDFARNRNRSTEMKIFCAFGALIAAGVMFTTAPRAEDCPPINTLGKKCGPYIGRLADNACFSPGSIFVQKTRWEPAERNKIAYSKSKKSVAFMYVVDGRKSKTKFDTIFVGVDRVGQQTSDSKIKLTKNKEFKFKKAEDKQKYSQGLNPTIGPTQIMRQWADLPDLGNVFLLKRAEVSDFDMPEATNAPMHRPHARMYRFDTGSVTCIGFDAGLNSDVDLILGKVVDSSRGSLKQTFFRLSVE